MYILRSILLGALLFLTACGGGGGGGDTVPKPPVDVEPILHEAPYPMPAQIEKSWVQVVVIDAFEGPIDAEYIIDYDPVSPVYCCWYHGPKVLEYMRRSTNAQFIAFDPFYNVSLMAFRQGILWAANNGAQVVNISWAGCCYSDTQWVDVHEYAFNLGVTVVWGAGNNGGLLVAANDPHAIVVGDTGVFADYGPAVDVKLSEGATSWDAAKASGIIAELYEELNPTPDAAGAALIRDTFIARYGGN